MTNTVHTLWNLVLNIGTKSDLKDFEVIRLQVINAFAVIASAIVLPFCVTFVSLGSSSALEGLVLIPFFAIILLLNYFHYYFLGRNLLVYGLICILTLLAISDRRTGTEYTIIAVGCCSVLVFDKPYQMFLSFAVAFAGYLLYVIIDAKQPFYPDPDLPYLAVQSSLMFLSGFFVVTLLIIFRIVLKKYELRLKVAHENMLAVNEELKSSNEKLISFTENLDSIVTKKSNELQAYKDAIDFSTCSAFMTTDATFLKVNGPLAQLTGYTVEELTNKNFRDILPNNSKEIIAAEFNEVHALGMTWSGEVKLRDKTGAYKWIDGVIIPLRNSERESVEYLFIGFPITERKENQQIKEKTLSLLESIAFKTSHEIRGPLSSIEGLANLVKNNMIKPEEISMIAEMFSSANSDLRNATSDLVVFVNERLMDYTKK